MAPNIIVVTEGGMPDFAGHSLYAMIALVANYQTAANTYVCYKNDREAIIRYTAESTLVYG